MTQFLPHSKVQISAFVAFVFLCLAPISLRAATIRYDFSTSRVVGGVTETGSGYFTYNQGYSSIRPIVALPPPFGSGEQLGNEFVFERPNDFELFFEWNAGTSLSSLDFIGIETPPDDEFPQQFEAVQIRYSIGTRPEASLILAFPVGTLDRDQLPDDSLALENTIQPNSCQSCNTLLIGFDRWQLDSLNGSVMPEPSRAIFLVLSIAAILAVRPLIH